MVALLQVQTTFAVAADAHSVARRLVEERLCACAQLLPGAVSLYRWEGELREEVEVLVLLKTTAERWPDLRDRLQELHPYDTPEVIALPAEHVSYDYLAWAREQLK